MLPVRVSAPTLLGVMCAIPIEVSETERPTGCRVRRRAARRRFPRPFLDGPGHDLVGVFERADLPEGGLETLVVGDAGLADTPHRRPWCRCWRPAPPDE